MPHLVGHRSVVVLDGLLQPGEGDLAELAEADHVAIEGCPRGGDPLGGHLVVEHAEPQDALGIHLNAGDTGAGAAGTTTRAAATNSSATHPSHQREGQNQDRGNGRTEKEHPKSHTLPAHEDLLPIAGGLSGTPPSRRRTTGKWGREIDLLRETLPLILIAETGQDKQLGGKWLPCVAARRGREHANPGRIAKGPTYCCHVPTI
jgi:hypothetical protein